ncbi:MAG: HEAT repeat domain-containing protein [Planctomycetaceae bacterium]|nr:HEAT repeat domain-containing protein [Planctomycetaceae bacterium]
MVSPRRPADNRVPAAERDFLPARRKHWQAIADMLKKDPSPRVRAAAATALGQSYACGAVPVLLESLDDREEAVYAAARRATIRICGVEAGFEGTDRRAQEKKYYESHWRVYGKTVRRYHEQQDKSFE